MPFESILFDRPHDAAPAGDGEQEPEFFGDLHLDQIRDALTAGRDAYDLAPFFRCPLHSVESVRYRHHNLRDLERPRVLEAVRTFAKGMREVRQCLKWATELHYDLQRQRWFVTAGEAYCRVVGGFAGDLADAELDSAGFLSLRDFLSTYIESNEFRTLMTDTSDRVDELAAVTYAVHIRGSRVKVTQYGGEPNMSEEVERAFAKFQQGAVGSHLVRFREYTEMNRVEAQILDLVAQLFPETFAALAAYRTSHEGFLDQTIVRFDREVQFYLAYLEYIAPLRQAGLAFSYPRVSRRSKEISGEATFDLSLAAKLVHDGESVVCNDFHLVDPERIFVVSGPNNGGKTTFARTMGQLHHLAGLGLPVPGRDTRLFLPDRVFTHFEREEDLSTLRGKFEDELVRIRAIFDQATPDSLLIMNESFGSTALHDAIVVGTEVVKQIIELDALCVFVTFVDELASLGHTTVSMMSTVVPEDPAVRTFKVVRRPADGLAYAAALAAKYGLTTEALRRRIAR